MTFVERDLLKVVGKFHDRRLCLCLVALESILEVVFGYCNKSHGDFRRFQFVAMGPSAGDSFEIWMLACRSVCLATPNLHTRDALLHDAFAKWKRINEQVVQEK